MEINKLLRPHLVNLTPYSSARDEFKGEADICLDANENSFGSTSEDRYRRYPDPYQSELKKKISLMKDVPTENIFIGNGSDEPIDLLIRAFCHPGKDSIIITPPTYGMYEVSAAINDVGIVRVPLKNDFSLDINKVLDSVEPDIKLIFLCSPNNPTGNSIVPEAIIKILEKFQGLTVVDEAYIDFSPNDSFIGKLKKFENLVVLQTFSKAWGLAALRLGTAYARQEVIEVLNKIKPPYNINGPSQELALKAIENRVEKDETVRAILEQKKRLESGLKELDNVVTVYPSDANFLLVKIKNAHEVYRKLTDKKIIVRDRSNVALCEDCLRITVGNNEENEALLKCLKEII